MSAPRSSKSKKPEDPFSSSGYLSNDTIAAVATALGGPIAIVRISGTQTFSILESFLDKKSQSTFSTWPPHSLHRANLVDPAGQTIDEALVAKFQNPASFTGEDVVELHIHGGSAVVARLMGLLFSRGVRGALPGEFSFRAVRNGKMTLSQAQAVSDLIASTNDAAASLALEKLAGSQNKLLTQIADDLRRVAMLSEAGIDFSDQDLDELALSKLKSSLEPIQLLLTRLSQSFERGNKIQSGVRVAFLGLPNAGKSSFFNALLGEDRSIVSDAPGTTRDVIREHLILPGPHGSVTLRLEDTAGLRHGSDEVETLGVARSQKAAKEADLILFLVDASKTELFNAALSQWGALGSPSSKTIGILTKSDLLSRSKGPLNPLQESALAPLKALGISPWILTSSNSSSGIHEAVQEITKFCDRWFDRPRGEVLLTHLTQKAATDATLAHLERAQKAPAYELFASDIRQALSALAPLIGETLPDDILGSIFSTFCIGK